MVDAELVLQETPSWTWSLFPNQSYLGRVQLTLRRRCDGSLATLTNDEWVDLRNGIRAIEGILGGLFQPDRFNYEQLGNVWTQVHVHAIPRYSNARHWCGITVLDQRWGDHPLPEPVSNLGRAETLQLAEQIRKSIGLAGL